MRRRRRATTAAVLIGVLLALAGAAPASGAWGYLSAFGTYGSGDGQFVNPQGIDVGPDGNLYVADQGNSRIQVIAPDGAFIRKWGTAGDGDGQFGRLLDVAVAASGNVYTAEGNWGGQGYNQIQKFGADGHFVARWGKSGGFNGIWALDVDAAENVYVADAGANDLVRTDSAGGGLVYWGSPGAGIGQFNQISGITIAGGSVYTVEASDGPRQNNLRVQKFDLSFAPLNDFSGSSSFPIGTADTLNANPGFGGIGVDAGGFVYLTGYHTLRFTPTGAQAERLLDCSGTDIAAHPNGKLYATGSVGILVFGDGGGSCEGKVPVRMTFFGDESVSINSGAQYTNDPVVQLTIEPPEAATTVRISNDGGFANAQSVAVAGSRQYAWTLDSSGPERLPKTIYVRFASEWESSAQNFTDDIILDQTPPVIEGATAAEARLAPFAAVRAIAAAAPAYTVRIQASDNASGVAQMQIAADRDNPGLWKPFAATSTFATTGRSILVRVRDGAGNASGWRALTADRTAPGTRIVGGPPKRTTRHIATFRFRASEAGSTFRCRLDRGAYRSCRSPKTYRALRHGRHVLRVAARDRAGNLDRTPAVRTWTVTR